MHRSDRFDEGHEFGDELPDLPIPRPGEGPAELAPQQHIAAPRLAGGASLTAAGADESPPTPTRAEAPELSDVDRERIENERFTWQLAARLTAGMLANPGRNHASVKDAMAMFDQFLHEMHAYTRISSEFGVLAGEGDRRRHHTEYFQGTGADETLDAAAHGATPGCRAQPRPEPAQPRPLPGYQPLPPGARAQYVPGSMAGAPPPSEPRAGDANEDAA